MSRFRKIIDPAPEVAIPDPVEEKTTAPPVVADLSQSARPDFSSLSDRDRQLLLFFGQRLVNDFCFLLLQRSPRGTVDKMKDFPVATTLEFLEEESTNDPT